MQQVNKFPTDRASCLADLAPLN